MTARKHCYFEGQVQGVGFRATAREIASNHAVAGWVRNLPDRRVELVIEGEAQDVDACLASLQARMSGYIRHVIVHDEPPQQERGFRIEH